MRDEENESMEDGTKNRALKYARHRNIVLLMNLEKLNSLRKYFGWVLFHAFLKGGAIE